MKYRDFTTTLLPQAAWGIFKENAEARREFYKLIDVQKR